MKGARKAVVSGVRLRGMPAGCVRSWGWALLLCLTSLTGMMPGGGVTGERLMPGICEVSLAAAQTSRPPDTGQSKCYDNGREIPCPDQGRSSLRDNKDGTISDINAVLMWQQGDAQNDDRFYTLGEAKSYCASLKLAGQKDWRLPSKRELLSIVNKGRTFPAIDTRLFPACRPALYWSDNTLSNDSDEAWPVHFGNGTVDSFPESDAMYVRCVRVGP